MPEDKNNTDAVDKDGKNTDTSKTDDSSKDDSQTGDDKDGGDDKDKFSWGFEDVFGKADDDDKDKGGKDDDDKDEANKVSKLEEEVTRLREEQQLRTEFESLDKKYGAMDGFPAVDKKQVLDFLGNDFAKMSPTEVGYILSNFGDILKSAKASTKEEVETQYSPEVTEQKAADAQTATQNERFTEIAESLKARWGVKKEA